MTHPAEASEGTPDAIQNQSARASAQAAGGNAPQPDDPTSPAAAAARAEATDREMREAGFGEHASVAMDKPATP